MRRFARETDFQSLTVQDLLEAREHYRIHLANLPTVVGTAVGRYRIRRKDKNARNRLLNHVPPSAALGARTLANSVVTEWSWPCVLVFVNQWLPFELVSRHPERMVPPRLYLPDGRKIPTCVIQIERREVDLEADSDLAFPSGLLGGGSPIFMDGQRTPRRGTVSCLVSDGTYLYALTSRHVLGDTGSEAFTFNRGERYVVGSSHALAAARYPLQDLYPGFAGSRALVTLDAGLVRLNNPSDWTCQLAGVGELGPPVDINGDTMSLDLIGCPLFCQREPGRRLEGEVQAMFFEYDSMFGTRYVAELLIGPRRGAASVDTRPGDSGALWLWDCDADKRVEKNVEGFPAQQRNQPIALQWGGQGFVAPSGVSTEFALASTLAGVCRQLDVEVVRGWNIGHSLYWGAIGHYKIALSACDLVQARNLDKLFTINADRISVSDDDISARKMPGARSKSSFIALADVPDLVWRSSRGKDKANHFADMDQPGGGQFQGKTLLQLWADPKTRKPSVWTAFYDSLGGHLVDAHRGALPFRVQEIYEAMVGYARKKQFDYFLCAGGILAHFVGDACQPLHVSFLHHGHPNKPAESDVHSAYETAMLDQFAPEVVTKVNALLKGKKAYAPFVGGLAAADAVVQLMKRTVVALPPSDVVDSYVRNKGNNQGALMWAELKDKTVARLADGARTLACIWDSAWIEGGADKAGYVPKAKLSTPANKNHLRTIYNDHDNFIPSRWLREMKP